MDIFYLILVLPTVIFAIYAQAKVKSAFNKYSQIPNRRGITGRDAAAMILQGAGITDVEIKAIQGSLTDYFTPKDKQVCLSEPVYAVNSIAAVGVAAHECGHAIQHNTGYGPLVLRNAIIPITQIGSNLSMPLILIGFIIEALTDPGRSSTNIGYIMIVAGLLLFGICVLFQLITLPVEFNASHRALEILKSSGMLEADELAGAKAVLSAAAMTYVAAMAQALANFLRLILIFGRRNSRD